MMLKVKIDFAIIELITVVRLFFYCANCFLIKYVLQM